MQEMKNEMERLENENQNLINQNQKLNLKSINNLSLINEEDEFGYNEFQEATL